ncbi:MAG: helix-turn-helix domain-containing protein [bacterium]|nr:helix-turn-helix domain-containing protein [bacterium]
MDNLLTTKQVLDILNIDRTTVYRMLKDGRLLGVKIGKQWRFSNESVERLVSGTSSVRESETAQPAQQPVDILQLHCLQPIQDVFAEIAEVGSVTTNVAGFPISNLSNCNDFCKLILNSEAGRKGCVKSWHKLTSLGKRKTEFYTCHAWLKYLGVRIEPDGDFIAMLFAGQIHTEEQDKGIEADRIRKLAYDYDIDKSKLLEASRKLIVLDDNKQEKLGNWLYKIANTFESIGSERSKFLNKLKKISKLTAFSDE